MAYQIYRTRNDGADSEQAKPIAAIGGRRHGRCKLDK
jgi:hypothetical protein